MDTDLFTEMIIQAIKSTNSMNSRLPIIFIFAFLCLPASLYSQASLSITAFSFPEQTKTATIDATNNIVDIEVAYDTDVTALTATFTLSIEATASVNGNTQTSEITTNDFMSPVTYTVIAQDGVIIQNWTVTVAEAAPSTDTVIKTFFVSGQTGVAIDADNHTIDVEVASGTDVSSLTPTVSVSENATIDPASGVARDFTSPVIYTVTAQDGSTTQDWTVTVTEGIFNAEDYLALVALYNDADGPNWINNSNWLNGPVDSWYGVTVADGRVRALRLENNHLVGNIPSELGDLSNITSLILDNNNLYGSIPVELGNLSNLRILSLVSDFLSGSIPSEFGNLFNLDNLYLHNNQLSGSIPSDLGNLFNLDNLHLHSNQLSGSIPSELGNLSNLTELYLNTNDLSESIPSELGNLSNLIELSLAGNQLSGSIPSELGNLSNLNRLSLNANSLSGSIPWHLGNLANLAFLTLASNSLTGSIPAELGNLINLSGLYLFENNLGGSIPAELGNLINLSSLQLFNNNLSGSIPAELGNLANLTALRLYSNDLSGSIPSELGNLTNIRSLYLYNNELTGSLPIEFQNLDNLQRLYLYSNKLDALPDLSGLTNLDVFRIYNNDFDFGDILPNIDIPRIDYDPQNQITGPDPISIVVGEELNISIPVEGSANQYQWVKGGEDLAGQISDNLVIENIDGTDEGVYYLAITNISVPNLTLRSNNIYVTVAASTTDILTFYITGQAAPAVIDVENHTIDIEVNSGTDLTSLVPSITLFTGGTISPVNGVVWDFTSPVTYTVTAQDGTTAQDWTVTVTEGVLDESDYLSLVEFYNATDGPQLDK